MLKLPSIKLSQHISIRCVTIKDQPCLSLSLIMAAVQAAIPARDGSPLHLPFWGHIYQTEAPFYSTSQMKSATRSPRLTKLSSALEIMVHALETKNYTLERTSLMKISANHSPDSIHMISRQKTKTLTSSPINKLAISPSLPQKYGQLNESFQMHIYS